MRKGILILALGALAVSAQQPVSTRPFAMRRVFPSGAGAVFIGTDTRQFVAVEYNSARTPPFRILSDAEARPWKLLVRTWESGSGAQKRVRFVEPSERVPLTFGPSGRFTLIPDPTDATGPEILIVEQRGAETIRHVLPQSTYNTFATARPERVRQGYSRLATQIDERVGAWKAESDRLWFGKSFYDGEGKTGVGGFGYFDTTERKFVMFAPPGIVDWSVSALEASPDAVWMALALSGEAGGRSGGLLRFDRKSEQVRHFILPDVTRDLARVGDRLLLATSGGMALVDGDQVRRYSVRRAPGGQLEVAAPDR
jgi:hypothetical protein